MFKSNSLRSTTLLKSHYTYVSLVRVSRNRSGKSKDKWCAKIRNARLGLSWYNLFDTEREAALGADKYLISKGLPPVNILKPKVL